MEIIAHRGASHAAPENTLAAVRLALDEAADGIEVDIRLSRDGVPMVIHDADLSRIAGLEKQVCELDATRLGETDAGSWFDPRFAGEPVPTLEAVCRLIPTETTFLIELKEGPEQVPALTRIHLPPRTRFISFREDTLRTARQQFSHVPCFLLTKAPSLRHRSLEPLIECCLEYGFEGIGPAAAWISRPRQLEKVLQRNLAISVWTVDEPEEAQRWQAVGAKMLTTNRPGFIQAKISPRQASKRAASKNS